MTYFDIEEEVQDYTVIISCGHAGINLVGILNTEEFSISMGSSVSSSLIASSIEGGIKGAVKGVLGKLFGNVGKNLASSFSTINSTIKTYEGSNDFSFSLSMNIYPRKFGNPSYSGIQAQIAKMTQPDISNSGRLLTSHLYDFSITRNLLNPLSGTSNYRIFDNQLICVTIGNWFKMCGLFCTSSNTTYSTIIDSEGKPLFVKADFTFTFYRALLAEDIGRMIRV